MKNLLKWTFPLFILFHFRQKIPCYKVRISLLLSFRIILKGTIHFTMATVSTCRSFPKAQYFPPPLPFSMQACRQDNCPLRGTEDLCTPIVQFSFSAQYKLTMLQRLYTPFKDYNSVLYHVNIRRNYSGCSPSKELGTKPLWKIAKHIGSTGN